MAYMNWVNTWFDCHKLCSPVNLMFQVSVFYPAYQTKKKKNWISKLSIQSIHHVHKPHVHSTGTIKNQDFKQQKEEWPDAPKMTTSSRNEKNICQITGEILDYLQDLKVDIVPRIQSILFLITNNLNKHTCVNNCICCARFLSLVKMQQNLTELFEQRY